MPDARVAELTDADGQRAEFLRSIAGIQPLEEALLGP
jgi:hypothetical protein